MNGIFSNDFLAPIEAVTPQQGGTTKRGVKADSGNSYKKVLPTKLKI